MLWSPGAFVILDSPCSGHPFKHSSLVSMLISIKVEFIERKLLIITHQSNIGSFYKQKNKENRSQPKFFHTTLPKTVIVRILVPLSCGSEPVLPQLCSYKMHVAWINLGRKRIVAKHNMAFHGWYIRKKKYLKCTTVTIQLSLNVLVCMYHQRYFKLPSTLDVWKYRSILEIINIFIAFFALKIILLS